MVKNEQSIPSREGAKKEWSKFSAFMRSLFGNNASDIRCNVILYLITLIFLAVLIAPFVYVITESFRSRQLVNGLPVEVWSFSAYKSVLGNPNIFRAYVNTIVVTIIGTAVAVALTTVGAYPLSKKDLPGRQVALVYVLITMLFSGGLIPFYILIRNVLQLTDSYLVYIAVGATGIIIICPIILHHFLFNISAAVQTDYRYGGAVGSRRQMERLHDGAAVYQIAGKTSDTKHSARYAFQSYFHFRHRRRFFDADAGGIGENGYGGGFYYSHYVDISLRAEVFHERRDGWLGERLSRRKD